MKITGSFTRSKLPVLISMVTAVAFGCALAMGCGKKENATNTPPPAADNPSTALAVAPPQVQDPDLSELNRQLRRWIVRNRRPPKNFDDFASSCGFQIPSPPPGKKYSIDKQMHIVLVNT